MRSPFQSSAQFLSQRISFGSMNLALMWLLGYVLPCALGVLAVLAYRRNHKRGVEGIVIIHAAGLVSIAINLYFLSTTGTRFVLRYSMYSLLLLLVSAAIAVIFLRKLGIAYSVSALIQEATLLAAAALLLPHLFVPLILLMLAPIFSFAHLLHVKHWKWKIPLTMAWGVIAVLLYVRFFDLLLNTAIHILLGTFFIKKGIIYAR
jgi:predicted outer membrane lipoprotein